MMYWIPLMLIALHLGSAQAVGPSCPKRPKRGQLPYLGAVSVANDLLGTDDKDELDYVGQIEAAKSSLNGLAEAYIEHKSWVIDILTGFVALEPIASKVKDENFGCPSSDIDHLTSFRAMLENYSNERLFSYFNKDRLRLVRVFSSMEKAFLKNCLKESRNAVVEHAKATGGYLKIWKMSVFPIKHCFKFTYKFRDLRSQALQCVGNEEYAKKLSFEIMKKDGQNAVPVHGSSMDRYVRLEEFAMKYCEQSCVEIDKDSVLKELFENGVKLVDALGPTRMLSHFEPDSISQLERRFIDNFLSYLLCSVTKAYIDETMRPQE